MDIKRTKSLRERTNNRNVEIAVEKPLLMTSPRLSPSAESLLPVCDVQRRAEASGGWGISGDISREVDRSISRLVTRIRGTSGVANWVRLPKAPDELGLRSRYIYIQYRIDGERCSIELELSRGIGSQNFRLALSTTAKEIPVVRGGALCLHLPGTRAKWTTLVVDTESAAECYTEALRQSRATPGSIILRAVTFRAKLSMRCIWSSNANYSSRTAPIEFSLRGKRRGGSVNNEDESEWIRLFGGEAPDVLIQESSAIEMQVVNDDVKVEGPSTPGGRSDILEESPISSVSRSSSVTRRHLFDTVKNKPRPSTLSLKLRIANTSASSRSALVWTAQGRLLYASGRSLCAVEEASKVSIRTARYHENRIDFLAISEDGSRLVSAQNPGITCDGEIISPVATLWATQNNDKDNDSALQWLNEWRPHERSVVTLSFSADASRLCSTGLDTHARVQIIVWSVERLLMPIPGVTSKVSARTPTRPFAISQLGFAIVAKQLSDFDIYRMRWSAYEADALVSCGKENVRFWRIKRDHLPAAPCALYEHARDTVFLDLAFEPSYAGGCDLPDAVQAWRRGKKQRNSASTRQYLNDGIVEKQTTEGGGVIPGDKVVYIASNRGQLLQVSYAQRALLCVLRLHDGPIVAVEATPGYILTASGDGVARLWPLDFGDFLMEARHEAPLLDACVSRDGLRVACVTNKGALGVLDVSSHSYLTLQRAHVGAVTDLSKGLGKHINKLASCASDGSVRIWELSENEDDASLSVTQRAEFAAANDIPTRLAWRAPDSDELAVGFRSGAVRIFDVARLCSLHTTRAHSPGAIVARLLFTSSDSQGFASPDGPKPLLYSAGSDGRIVAYDSTYTPLRIVPIDAALPPTLARGSLSCAVALTISPDGMTIAAVSDGCVYMLDALNLQRLPVPKLDDQDQVIVDLHWSQDNYLWLTTADGVRIRLLEDKGCWYSEQKFILDARQRKDQSAKKNLNSSRYSGAPAVADALAISSGHLAGAAYDTAIEVAPLPSIKQDSTGIKRLPAHRVDLAHSSSVTRILFDSDHCLISADADGVLCFWHITNHTPVEPVNTDYRPTASIANFDENDDDKLPQLQRDDTLVNTDDKYSSPVRNIEAKEEEESPGMTIAMPVGEHKEEISDVEGIIPPESVTHPVAACVAIKSDDQMIRGAAAVLYRFNGDIGHACWNEGTAAIIAAQGSLIAVHGIDGTSPRILERRTDVVLLAAAQGLIAAATSDSLAVYDLAGGNLCFEVTAHAIAALTFRSPGIKYDTLLMSLDHDGHFIVRDAHLGTSIATTTCVSNQSFRSVKCFTPALCAIRANSDSLLAATVLSSAINEPLRVSAWQMHNREASGLFAAKAWTIPGSTDASSVFVASPDGDAAFLVACDSSGILTVLPLNKDDDHHSRFEVIDDSEHRHVVALTAAGDRYRGYTIAIATPYSLLLLALDTTHTQLMPIRELHLNDHASPIVSLSCDSVRARHGVLATSDGTILFFDADNAPENNAARQQAEKLKNIIKRK